MHLPYYYFMGSLRFLENNQVAIGTIFDSIYRGMKGVLVIDETTLR